jgi:phosphoglycerol transferase MdoB-like AlkP superfamily enzyme
MNIKQILRRWAVPWDLAGRIVLLFLGLCLIKLVMLLGFHKHMVETHWRIETGWFHYWGNELAFILFVLLLAIILWQFGNRCAAAGVATVRAANLCVLGLGAAFILLTFRTGDKNYLISLFVGAQSWRELCSAFFSQPPVWSLWLVIYSLFYYLFVRLGREYQVLRITAVLAAIYALLFLQDIKGLRDSLVVVDCVGGCCLLAGAGCKKSLGLFWQAQPWVWMAFIIFFLKFDELKNLEVEFIVFSSLSIVLLAGASTFAWRGQFYPAWSWLLPFASVAFLLFSNINYKTWLNYQNLFCLGLTLPHYFLGEFILALALLVVALLYRRFLPSESLLWLDVLILLFITLALADLRLTQIMGVRLDWQAIKFGADFKMVWREAAPYLPDMVFGLILLASVYAVLVALLRRADLSPILRFGTGWKFFLAAFVVLGVAGYWIVPRDKAQGESALLLVKTSPLFTWADNPIMDKKTFMGKARQLGLAQMLEPPALTPTRPPRDLNVVLIFQESSYNKYLSLFDGRTNTEPLLEKYKDRMELFPNLFSSFAASVNARFATLTGLYPVRDYDAFTFHRVDVKSIFDILHEQGYVSSVYYSASFDYTGFRDFLRGRNIDLMFDADTMPGRGDEPPVSWGVREGVTLKAVQNQIKQYAAGGQKFFLSYIPAAPHNPFDGIPLEFCKFPMTNKDDYVSQYQNELLYLDWVITSILDELKKNGLLDHTLVIITDDHGEMLGENGGPIGHGWAVTPELANVPLIIMDPNRPGYHINDTIGSQVDLLPTILDLLGISLPPDQLYQGTSLYAAYAQTDRKIYLNSFEQYAVIEGHRVLQGDRENDSAANMTNSSFKVFSITNDGAHTIFPEIKSSVTPSPPMSQFDAFQENLLMNYSHYSQMIHSSSPAGN